MAEPVLIIAGELLVGRDDTLKQLERNRARVHLITGETGIGKSLILRALSASTADGLFSAPQQIRHSDPLAAAIFRALADVLAQTATNRQRARDVADSLRAAVESIGVQRGVDLAKAFGLVVASALVGGAAVEAARAVFSEVQSEFRNDRSAGLAAQIEAVVGPTMLDAIVALVEASVASVNGRHLTCLVDAGERLDDYGRRLLADLAEMLPPGCSITLAHATSTPEQVARVAELRRMWQDIEVTELLPLSAAEIASWQAEERFGDLDPEAILAHTGGNPQLLADVLAEVRTGASLEEVPVREVFARLTVAAFEQLSDREKLAVRRLAVLEDPTPDETLLKITGLSAEEWSDVVTALTATHLFSDVVAGVPWFHQRRREVIVDRLLRPQEIPGLAYRALDAIRRYAAAAPAEGDALAGEGARLAALASPERLSEVERALMNVDTTQLALLAALLEVWQPTLDRTGLANVARYARGLWHAEGDLVDAAQGLETAELVALPLSPTSAFIAPAEWTPMERWLLRGRCARELGRRPAEGLAAVVFGQYLGAHLLLPAAVNFGFGEVPAAQLVRSLATATRGYDRRRPPPAAVVRALYQAYAPIWLTALYLPDRGPTQAELETELDRVGSDLQILEAIAMPIGVVRCDRWVRAAEVVLGVRPGTGLDGVAALPLSRHMTLRERLHATQQLTHLSSEHERLACQLTDQVALHWGYSGDRYVELEVHNVEPAVVEHETLSVIGTSHQFSLARLQDELGLQPQQYVTTARTAIDTPGPEHPAVRVIEAARGRGAAFNETQPPRGIELSESALTRLVIDERARLRNDADALARAALFGDAAGELETGHTRLLVGRPTQAAVGPWLAEASLQLGEPESVDVVVVDLESAPEAPRIPARAFEEAFGTSHPWQTPDGHVQRERLDGVISLITAMRPDDVLLESGSHESHASPV